MNYPHPILAREGWPYIGASILAAAAVWILFGFAWSLPLWIIVVFVVQFFRDPPRPVPAQPNAVLSAADGRVVCVRRTVDPYTQTDSLLVSVFMNVFNAHSNRSPVDGAVERIEYKAGTFVNADLDKASTENERNALVMQLPGGLRMSVVQVAGLVARRIVCHVKAGDALVRGQRYGFIRFGSRVDIYLPLSARPRVAVGDKVYATSTVIAELLRASSMRFRRRKPRPFGLPASPLTDEAPRVVRRRRGIYLLPNLFTLAALFAGFYAIVQAMNQAFELAAIAIFAAMVLDGMDGRVARLTNTQSAFGEQFDSLSDMTSFGVAPALVMYEWVLQDLGRWGWAGAFVYCAGAALRLARFNANLAVVDKRFFQGLPSPAAAALIAGFVWLAIDNKFQIREAWLPWVAFLLTVYAGFTMVSSAPFYSGKSFQLGRSVPFWVLVAAIALIFIVSSDPPIALFTLFCCYALSGYVYLAWRWSRREPNPTRSTLGAKTPPPSAGGEVP